MPLVNIMAFNYERMNKQLIREVAAIVVIKIIILMIIKSIWFSAPTVPVDREQEVIKHIIGS